MAMINTVADFVEACGGNSPTAKAFAVGESTVSMWKARGRIPAWATMRAMQIASANQMALDPDLLASRRPRRKKIKRAALRRQTLHAAE